MDPNQVIADLRKVRWKRGPYVWEPFMRKYNCQVICELGACKGVNFQAMIRHNPRVAVGVDAWRDDGHVSRNDGGYAQAELNQQYEDVKQSVVGKPGVKLYREYTFDAVGRFEDNYFDVVYIDADHSYQGCLRDINDWYPKVKPGRFLLGDDYRIYEGRRRGVTFGVIEAVNEFVKNNNLDFFELPHYGWGIIRI